MTERNSPEFIREGIAAGRFRVAAELQDQFELEMVESACSAEDIPHVTRTVRETAWSFLFAPQKGFGVLIVRDADAARVKEILADLRATDASAAELAEEQSVADAGAPIAEDDAD